MRYGLPRQAMRYGLPRSNYSLSICWFFAPFLFRQERCPKEADLRGATGQSRPLRYPPPHRHPAFKNVPIFERFHSANLQVCSVEPAENRNIFSGRWSKAAGVGSGARMRFARNASPRTTSLVTFLFGHKKVTSAIGSINSNSSPAFTNNLLKCPNWHLQFAFLWVMIS